MTTVPLASGVGKVSQQVGDCGGGEAFCEALKVLVAAHETEVRALRAEVELLRGRLKVEFPMEPEESAFNASGACSSECLKMQETVHQSTCVEPTRSDRVVPFEAGLEEKLMDRVSVADQTKSDRFTAVETSETSRPKTHRDEGPSAATSACIQRWADIVGRVVEAANLNQSELHPVWVQTEGWVRRIRWNNVSVDVWPIRTKLASQAYRRNGRRSKKASRWNSITMIGDKALGGMATKFSLKVWEIYGAIATSGTIACVESHLVVEPQSPIRICWASVGVFLMLYDLIILPMQAFQLPESTSLLVMNWFQQLFWTFDIVFSFFTAIYVNTELVRDLGPIAKAYAKSWLAFDLGVLLPLWVEKLVGSGVSSLSAFRYVRMLRFLRLARLAKFERMLSDALAAINSPVFLLVLGMVKLMFCLVCVSHVNACIWFLMGEQEPGGWTAIVRDRTIFYKYVMSMHWALTQYQGTSEIVPGISVGERVYAVTTVLFSLLILSSFVSSLTNMMMQLQALHDERTFQQRAVRSYLSSKHISTKLSIRVKKYIEWKQTVQGVHSNTEVFNFLPLEMVMDLNLEVHSPCLSNHEFMNALLIVYPRLSRRLLHQSLKVLSLAPGELVFSGQETCFYMYFVQSGELNYVNIIRKQSEVEILGEYVIHPTLFLSEPSLWMHWQHKGDLTVSCFAGLLTIAANEFGIVISSHPPAHASCVLYARRFISGMVSVSWKCTDIIDPGALIPEDRAFEDVGLHDVMTGAAIGHRRTSQVHRNSDFSECSQLVSTSGSLKLMPNSSVAKSSQVIPEEKLLRV